MKAFLDTHAAIFLWEGRIEAFGKAATALLERSALFVSPLVRLELAFLKEVGKLRVDPDRILGGLVAELGVSQSDDPLASVVARSMELTWTRDPFDRLLVATAILHQAPFVSRDERIRKHYKATVW
ncbi:MAG: PIN domain-containing protein [Acidobacteriota bacterium]